ncbi:MAG: hypothetical protein K0R05_240 [Anaerocolumna sp.]|jgi:hypothetical protein|nr:hypothetical protein [Anaerocolumna sp.]
MENKIRIIKKIQYISCICYAVSIIILYVLGFSYVNSSRDNLLPGLISIGVISIISFIVTCSTGIYKGFLNHKMGIRSSKKDCILIIIAGLLVACYYLFK